jgi:hypothetical protein
MQSFASIETANASRYLGQFCKHFAHKLPVALAGDNTSGTVDFGAGTCQLNADETSLTLAVTAATPQDQSSLQAVVERHLVRFAFREEITLQWR